MKLLKPIGMNRTGIAASPLQGEELFASAKAGHPSSRGDETTLAAIRVLYSREAPVLGSVPPPIVRRDASRSIIDLIRGEKAGVLLDKLGERLAFERLSVRMFDALMAKFRAGGTWQGGPTIQELSSMRDDELRHFEIVRRALARLGADSTAMTPSGDLAGVLVAGTLDVLSDPRVTPPQGLQAILMAELADHDAWALLVELAGRLGEDGLASEMRAALVEEQRHVSLVRVWIRSYVMGEGTLDLDHMLE